MNIEQIYKDANALLEGHFKLSSGNHSQFYLQSAKSFRRSKTAKLFAEALAVEIKNQELKLMQFVLLHLGINSWILHLQLLWM